MEVAQVVVLARITIAVALRNEKQLDIHLKQALAAGISVPLIRETILQCYLFAGYAAAINALIVLNRIVPGNHDFLQETENSTDVWAKRGTELCRKIYGNQFDRLIENMNRLHPDLSNWMVVEGYGKVLSRPFLPIRIRELLIVAITAILNVERQFHSHVRGALYTGATPAELRAVFSEASIFMDAEAVPYFASTMEKILASRKDPTNDNEPG